MINENASDFYNKVVYSDEYLDVICNQELKECSQMEIEELYINFLNEFESTFIKNKANHPIKEYHISNERLKRMRIAMLILQVCAEGIPFSLKVVESSTKYWNSLMDEVVT